MAKTTKQGSSEKGTTAKLAKKAGKGSAEAPKAGKAPVNKAGKAGKAQGKASDSKEEKGSAKRKLGLRGAAPWAARHAAKHAAEARARAAEPAPPGSARATIRVPVGAEEIKARIAELHNQVQKIRTLRKRLDKGFWDIGVTLLEVQQQELFQAKGYGSFEAFLEREIDLGKQTSLKLMKVSQVFQREAALDFGMDKVLLSLAVLEGEAVPQAAPSAPGSRPPLPLKPPMRIVG